MIYIAVKMKFNPVISDQRCDWFTSGYL